MDLNGLWTASFASGTDDSGAGVVMLLNGIILGGNSSYYYTGTYFMDGPSFKGRMTATHFFGDSPLRMVISDSRPVWFHHAELLCQPEVV